VLQEARLALAAGAHVREPQPRPGSHREYEVRPHEDVDLAEGERPALELDGVQHEEERVAVLLQLGPLVPMPRVLDRELMEPELPLHRLELGGLGVLSATQTKHSGLLT
jgi:hypothetical protein